MLQPLIVSTVAGVLARAIEGSWRPFLNSVSIVSVDFYPRQDHAGLTQTETFPAGTQ